MKFLQPILIFIIALIIVFLWWNNASQPPSQDKTLYPFIITKGLGASQIAQLLEKEGFIRSQLAFRLYVQTANKSRNIQAGDYRITKNKNLPNLVKELTQGPIGVWVTLPEGMRKEEIGIKIAKDLNLNETESIAFLNGFNQLTVDKEGFLFPDTYLLPKNANPSTIITTLNNNFKKKLTSNILQKAKQQGLIELELVTLASIIERETHTNEERPIVAGILLKRLEIGMPLQVDATLQYAIASAKCKIQSVKCDWWQQITREDKRINSLYNTYTHPGLPPGPIANPGLSSLKAAADPEDSPYLYYLHDNQGNIHYAKTLEEHNTNIDKYL